MKSHLRLGTRGSSLALLQAHEVRKSLSAKNALLEISIVTIKTTGDVQTDREISEMGTKAVFVKELDEALLEDQIDFAVHSLKDLPSQLHSNLKLTAVCHVEDPRDALVSRKGKLKDLPKKAIVGTASLRRRALLNHIRPDLSVQLLRGNLDTRIRRLDEGQFDAIVVAYAGLKRSGQGKRATELLDPLKFPPAIGQGKLGLMCRANDTRVIETLSSIDDSKQHQIADIERVFMAHMEGGCQVPIGCYSQVKGNTLHLLGLIASLDGRQVVSETLEGPIGEGKEIATRLSREILAAGGESILRSIREGR